MHILKIKLQYKREVSIRYNIPINEITVPDQDYYRTEEMYFFFWDNKKYVEKSKLLTRHFICEIKEIENWVYWDTGQELKEQEAMTYIKTLNKAIYDFLLTDIDNFPDLFNKKIGETEDFIIFEYLHDYTVAKDITDITDKHFELLQKKLKYYKENRKYNLLPSMDISNWMITDTDIKYVDMDSFIFCNSVSCFFKQVDNFDKLQRITI